MNQSQPIIDPTVPTTPINPAATPTAISPTPIAPEEPKITPKKAKTIKTVVVTLIIILVIVLGSILGTKLYKSHTIKVRATKDQQIIDILFSLRKNATDFYSANHSYKDWWPQGQTLVQVNSLGSTLIYRKPDFQSYIFYAFDQTNQKYFCIDTNSFADLVPTVTDEQIKCQP